MASILNDLRKKTGWCCDWTAPSVLIVSRGPQSTTPQRGQRRQLASASLFADAGRRYFQKKKTLATRRWSATFPLFFLHFFSTFFWVVSVRIRSSFVFFPLISVFFFARKFKTRANSFGEELNGPQKRTRTRFSFVFLFLQNSIVIIILL